MKTILLSFVLLTFSLHGQSLDSLNNVLDSLFDAGAYKSMLLVAQSAVSLLPNDAAERDTSYCTSLFWLALAKQKNDLLYEADSLYEWTLGRQLALSGEQSFAYLRTLQNLALLHTEMEDYSKAESLFQKSIELRKKVYGQNSTYYAWGLNGMSMCYGAQGKFLEAEKLEIEAMSVIRKNSGVTSYYYLQMMNNLAVIYLRQGEYEKAQPVLEKSLELGKVRWGEDHYNLTYYLTNLAITYRETGRLSDAEQLYLKCIEIETRHSRDSSFSASTVYTSLGILYEQMGRYYESENLYRKSKSIIESTLGKDNKQYGAVINNLGIVEKQLGRIEQALIYNREAMELLKHKMGEDHPDFIAALNNYASLLHGLKRYTEARIYMDSVAAIRKKVIGAESPDYCASLFNQGSVYAELNRYGEAHAFFQEAIQLTKKIGHYNTLETVTGLFSYADLFRQTGKIDSAIATYQEAIRLEASLIKRMGGVYTDGMREIGLIYANNRKFNAADSCFINANNGIKAHLITFFNYLSEKEKIAYYNLIKPSVAKYYSYAAIRKNESRALLRSVYDYRLLTKGLLFSYAKRFRAIIENSDNDSLKNRYHHWIYLKKQISDLYSYTFEELAEAGYNLDSLIREANLAEREMQRNGNIVEAFNEIQETNFDDIRNALKADEAAVEIVRFPFYSNREESDTVCYLALVVTREQKKGPVAVALFNGTEMENDLFDKYKSLIELGRQENATLLYNKYWGEFAKYLVGKKRVYLSLDGVYNKINLATLKNPVSKKYLLSEKDLVIVANTSDIVRTKHAGNTGAGTKAVLFGDPDFNAANKMNGNVIKPMPSKEPIDAERSALLTTSAAMRIRLDELPGTKTEVEKIGDLLRQNSQKVELYLNDKADEETLKNIRNPKILHLATHGAFFSGEEAKRRKFRQDETGSSTENPLLRSMLFFAGAERTLSGGRDALEQTEDGVLTAYEAMNLYLQNTELVVLSACQSGVGEINNGEGVYGMQRAFQTAGARYVLMSLWNVNDNSTSELMQSFYRNWTNGKTIRVAFKLAQEEIKKKYPHPFFWGAFVLVGQ